VGQTQDNLVKVDHLQVVLTDTKDGVDLVVLVDRVEQVEEVVDLVDGVVMVLLSRNQEILGLVLAAVVEEAAVVPEELDLVMLEPIMQDNREVQDLLGELVNLVLPVKQGKQGKMEMLFQLKLANPEEHQQVSPLK